MKKAKKRREPHIVRRMPEDELKNFVRDYLAGLIVTSEDMDATLVPTVFMPLALGAIQGWSQKELAQLGAVWAHRTKDRSTGLGVNGYPMFVACRLMRKEDWAIVAATINREREQRTDIKLEKTK